MQALLKSTQKQRIKKNHAKPKKGKEVIPEYDAFPVINQLVPRSIMWGKILVDSPLKEDVYVVLWQNNHISIPLCACWFMRTLCTSTHEANIAMDQWSVGSGMRWILVSRRT